MTQYAYYDTPLSTVQISCEEESIVSIHRTDKQDHPNTPSPLSDLAASQLAEYFAGSRKAFDLPIHPQGTAFQEAVWQALLDIPYGETRSYQDIAAAIGNPAACRAVGMACHNNPIWIVIPCHRVVGRNHSLTGYAGGLDMKQALLNLEQR